MVEYTDYVATFADPSRQIVDIDTYTYTIDGDVLSANITQTAPQVFNTQMVGDCDFVLFYLSAFARINGQQVMTVNPAILVQIAEPTTGRTFFAGPSPLPLVAGQGGFPFLLPGPRVIRARSQLQATFISAQAQAFSGIYFCYHGARIWYG